MALQILQLLEVLLAFQAFGAVIEGDSASKKKPTTARSLESAPLRAKGKTRCVGPVRPGLLHDADQMERVDLVGNGIVDSAGHKPCTLG